MSDETLEELGKLTFEQLLVRLSTREQAFVHAYDGNNTEAAEAAGFKGNKHVLAVSGCRVLRRPIVRMAIAKRTEGEMERFILSREERQELWSRIALDEDTDTQDRLKALELLGKSQADFTERLEVKGELTLEQLVREAHGEKA